MRLVQDATEEYRVADQKGRILLGSRYAGKQFALRTEPDGTTVLTPVVLVPEADAITAKRLDSHFSELERLQPNWDGHGSMAPQPVLIRYAREVVAVLQASAIARGMNWVDPHVGSNERGQITLEWWHGDRSLTLIVRSEEQVDYLKAWGADIETEMEDGEVSKLSDFAALSHWLRGKD